MHGSKCSQLPERESNAAPPCPSGDLCVTVAAEARSSAVDLQPGLPLPTRGARQNGVDSYASHRSGSLEPAKGSDGAEPRDLVSTCSYKSTHKENTRVYLWARGIQLMCTRHCQIVARPRGPLSRFGPWKPPWVQTASVLISRWAYRST